MRECLSSLVSSSPATAPTCTPGHNAERKTLVFERGEGVLRTAVRLACQARVSAGAQGPIVVQKAGVRPPADA